MTTDVIPSTPSPPGHTPPPTTLPLAGNAIKYQHAVSYQRRGTRAKRRTFPTPAAAGEYVAKILSKARPDLAPVTFLRLDRRAVGPWTAGETLIDLEEPRW